MLAYLARRLAYVLPTLLLVSMGVFLLLSLIPGDTARAMLGPDATPEEVAALRHHLGLDRPAIYRLGLYFVHLAQGDLGMSLQHKVPVSTLLAQRLPNTLRLAGFAIFLSLVIAIPVGTLAAVKRNSVVDFTSMVTAIIGVSVPVFWMGILLIYLFSVRLRWFPTSGMGRSLFSIDGLRHLVLPGFALSTALLGSSTRLLRASMLEILNEDYIRTARSKGLRELKLIFKHALRNAINPLLTNVGMQLGVLLGGSILTETVFAWPGIGRLLVNAVYARDYPLVQGVALVMAGSVLFFNLLADLLYVAIDPRIRYE